MNKLLLEQQKPLIFYYYSPARPKEKCVLTLIKSYSETTSCCWNICKTSVQYWELNIKSETINETVTLHQDKNYYAESVLKGKFRNGYITLKIRDIYMAHYTHISTYSELLVSLYYNNFYRFVDTGMTMFGPFTYLDTNDNIDVNKFYNMLGTK